MSGINFTVVKFSEFEESGKMNFLFFKDQCRHCSTPLCKSACWNAWYQRKLASTGNPAKAATYADDNVAIIQKADGTVLIHKGKCKPWKCSPSNPVKPCQDYQNGGCPFPGPGQNLGIPRYQYVDWNGNPQPVKARADKCDLCHDRRLSTSDVNSPPFTPGVFTDSNIPACELACPTDAILFGEESAVQAVADARIAELKANGYPKADIYPRGFGTHVKWILTEDPLDYGVTPA
jgi:formate dehydrogenase iron-sulfur subunit